jgi:Glycosyltransferase like family
LIAFGTAITDPEIYARIAEPGIRLASEPDSEILSHASESSIFRNYNLMLDMASKLDDLEALVLIHQDAELVDADFCDKVRSALSDPDVGIVGCAGAIGVRSIAWWSGSVRWASFTHRYPEFGGGEIPALSWIPEKIPSYAHKGEVDTIDGVLIVMSPWAVRELRFDESLGQLHGYDYDLCLQVRAAGKKVIAEDLRVIHHHSLHLLNDPDGWISAHIRIAEKWDGQLGGVPGADWRQRALRAEAEGDANRLLSIAAGELRDARAAYDMSRIVQLNEALLQIESSFSWRATRPLRSAKAFLSRLRNRREPAANQD